MFFSYLFKVYDIDNFIENVIADFFFHNLNHASNGYEIFFVFCSYILTRFSLGSIFTRSQIFFLIGIVLVVTSYYDQLIKLKGFL